jgi:sugar phosphate permease
MKNKLEASVTGVLFETFLIGCGAVYYGWAGFFIVIAALLTIGILYGIITNIIEEKRVK